MLTSYQQMFLPECITTLTIQPQNMQEENGHLKSNARDNVTVTNTMISIRKQSRLHDEIFRFSTSLSCFLCLSLDVAYVNMLTGSQQVFLPHCIALTTNSNHLYKKLHIKRRNKLVNTMKSNKNEVHHETFRKYLFVLFLLMQPMLTC